ncbi:acyltransferase [Chryseobacterium sp. ERMR1:04]|uniref:acyltransferase family protein n=1 Tax=Chryseobacterium sp. ERMR1:04 TaxID=1705393 RepID=UPI0006C852B2|nr:hypothetical protein AMQ68_18830 [Chryseobacterium sp. ERMR1:04]
MEPAKKTVFFTGLNELRAVAALDVIFHHIEVFKHSDHIGSLFNSKYSTYFIENLGENGVYLFFVLSGFLITYLLISEKEKNNTINLKKFYLRRILRIWPLYYLIVLISFTLIPLFAHSFTIFSITPNWYDKIMDPSNYSLKTILLYILFLPNLALKTGKIVVGASQSWSVGVEEQFYILWPLIVSFFRKNLLVWVFGLILFTFIITNVKFPQSLLGHITSIIPFEFMAIGGIGGYYYSKYPEIITKYTKSKFIYLTTALLICFLISTPIFKHYIQSLISGFLFLLLIIISINQSNRSVFTNRSFSFLGNISYGIYMYHPIVMFFIFPISYKLLRLCNNIYLFNIFIYLLIPSLTIFISYLSFEYMEKYFIKIKDTKFKTL